MRRLDNSNAMVKGLLQTLHYRHPKWTDSQLMERLMICARTEHSFYPSIRRFVYKHSLDNALICVLDWLITHKHIGE